MDVKQSFGRQDLRPDSMTKAASSVRLPCLVLYLMSFARSCCHHGSLHPQGHAEILQGIRLQAHLGQACLECCSKLFLACRYGVRKALVHEWPLRRLRREMDRQRSAAGVCMECRQKLHILCVRARCRECCQRSQLTEDCQPHSSDAAKTRKTKLIKTKARKQRKRVINADAIMISAE